MSIPQVIIQLNPLKPTTFVFAVLVAMCLGQFAIGFFVPQKYRRNRPLTLLEQRRRKRASVVEEQAAAGQGATVVALRALPEVSADDARPELEQIAA